MLGSVDVEERPCLLAILSACFMRGFLGYPAGLAVGYTEACKARKCAMVLTIAVGQRRDAPRPFQLVARDRPPDVLGLLLREH